MKGIATFPAAIAHADGVSYEPASDRDDTLACVPMVRAALRLPCDPSAVLHDVLLSDTQAVASHAVPLTRAPSDPPSNPVGMADMVTYIRVQAGARFDGARIEIS